MNELQIPPRLNLTVSEGKDWKGTFYLSPEVAPEDAELGKPGPKPGDTVFVSGDPFKLLVSLGTSKKMSTANIRKAGKAAAKLLVSQNTKDVGLRFSDFVALGFDNALDAFCEGMLLGAFQFDRYKTKDDEYNKVGVHILVDGEDEQVRNIVHRVSTIGKGVNLAREWSHEPANVINPVTLAGRARESAAENGLECKVFGKDELSEMGAGAILSVGLGSKTPSQMIVLKYPGHEDGVGTSPVIVIGKAITFDTGGYSLKNTKGIVGMKFDKCGGMAVLGIMDAVASLKLPVPVIGIIAAAENMISSDAYRPNDIITSLSGKTIEIISTDAEGRMVLSDALTYASTEFSPRSIIDLATLTGGVVVALGKYRAGLMSNHDRLADELSAAGERTDERLWRLPLDEEYFELIKGSDSDLKNSSGAPMATSIVGGTFLKQFVMNEVPWAHIDIAGTAWDEQGPGGGKSATGFGVRLLIDYLANLSL